MRTPKVFVQSPAQALVTMHQYNRKSLMWQTIFVRGDGSGVLTSLIGETAGAPQTPFRLPSGQLARLRGLIDAVRAGEGRSGTRPLADAYVYALHVAGMPSQNEAVRAPRPVADLIAFLSQLAFSECC